MKHFYGRISKKIRITATLTLICFLVQATAWNHSVCALPDAVKPAFNLPEKISVPKALGIVETQNLHPQSGKPLIIYLQDAHAVTSAQSHLRKLIAYLQNTYHIPFVALEGGSGSLDTTLLRAFPDSHLRRKIMREYFERGEMTGAEMAAVLNSQPARYEGIEDWELYESNYRAYLEAMQNKAGLLKKITQIQNRLDKERASAYSGDQNDYYKLTAGFYEDPASFSKLLDYLNQTEARREKAAVYPRLKSLMNALRDESALEAPLRQAAEKFKASFLKELNSDDQKLFQKNSQAFLTGKMSPVSFLAFLDVFARTRKLPLDLAPSLKEARQNARSFYAVKGTQVFEELESCLLEIEKDLFVSAESKKLLEQYRRLRMLKQLVSLELSRKQWESLRDNPENFAEIRSSKKDIMPAMNFYQGAIARDRALHENLEKIISKYKAPAVMVIAGGFHRQGFEQALKDSGYSYAVVTPCMQSLEGQERYEDLMRGKVSWGGEIRESLYDAFSRHSVKKLAAGLNPLEFPRQMKNWRDEILRRLSAENRLDQAGQYTKYIDEILQPVPDNEKIRKAVGEVLRQYQSQTQESIWKKFEKQFSDFSSGIEQLKNEKRLNAENIRRLMTGAIQRPSFLGMDIQKLNPEARFSPQSMVMAAHRSQGNTEQLNLFLRAEIRTADADDPEHIFSGEPLPVSADLGGSVLVKAFGEPDAIGKDEYLHYIQSEFEDDKPSGILKRIGGAESVSRRLYTTLLPLLTKYHYYGYDNMEDMWAELLDVLWLKRQTLIDHLDSGRPVNGYIEVTAHHWLVDQYRKEKRKHGRERNQSSSQSAGKDEKKPVEFEQTREPEVFHDQMIHEQLEAGINRLSLKYQALVRMHFWEHLSYKQIAERTGVPEPKVRWTIVYAIQKLRRILNGQAELESAEELPRDQSEHAQLDTVNAAVNRLEKDSQPKTEALHAVMRLYMAGRKYSEIEQAVKVDGKPVPSGTIKRWIAQVEQVFREDDKKNNPQGPKLYESLMAIRARNGGQIHRPHKPRSNPELKVSGETHDDESGERHEIRTGDETGELEENAALDEFSSFERSLEDLRLLDRLWEGENADRYEELKSLIYRYAAVRGMKGTLIRMMKAFVNGKTPSFNEVAGEIFAAARLQEQLSPYYETEILGLGFHVGPQEFDIFLKVSRKKNVQIPAKIVLEDGLYLVEAKEDPAPYFHSLIQATIEKQIIPQQRYASMLAAAGVPFRGFIVAVGGPNSAEDGSQKAGVLKQETKVRGAFRRTYSIVLRSFDVQNSRAPSPLPQAETPVLQGRQRFMGSPWMMYAAQWLSYFLGGILKKAETPQTAISQPPPKPSEEQMRLWAAQRTGILNIFKHVLNPAFQIWPRLHEIKARAKGEDMSENEKLIGRTAAHILDTLQRMEGQRLKLVQKIMRQKEVRRKQLAQELEKRESEADAWEDIFRAHNLEDPNLAENPNFFKEVLRAYFSNRSVPLPALRNDLQEHYWAEETGESGPVKVRNPAGAWEWLKRDFQNSNAVQEEKARRKAAALERREAAKQPKPKKTSSVPGPSPQKIKFTPRQKRASIVREFTQSILASFEKAKTAGPFEVGMQIPENPPDVAEIYRVLLRFLKRKDLIHPVTLNPVVFSIATTLQNAYFSKGREQAGKPPKERSPLDWFYAWPVLKEDFGRQSKPERKTVGESAREENSRQELREVLFSDVPLEDSSKLYDVLHAMTDELRYLYIDDTFRTNAVKRVFVKDPFGRTIREWPLDTIFSSPASYKKLRQLKHIPQKMISKEFQDFQSNLEKAMAGFMKLAGINILPGKTLLTFSRENAPDGTPLFYIDLNLPGSVPALTDEDFMLIPEVQRIAFRQAFESFYPLLWNGGHFNAAVVDREAEQEEHIADRNPLQWEFYYEAAVKRMGETAEWLRHGAKKSKPEIFIFETRHLLSYAVHDLTNVLKHLHPGGPSFEAHIQQLQLLIDYGAAVAEIFDKKQRQTRHEIRVVTSDFELPDDKLRSEIEKTFVSFEQLREKDLIIRVPVFLFQEETEAEDLDNFDVDAWEELMYQKKIGQKWDEYVVRLDAEGNPQVLYQPADSHYGPVLWNYPEVDEETEDFGLTIPAGDKSWERAAEIKRWQGLLERLPQKKLDEDFRESLRRHFESIIADLQGRVIFSIQKDSDAGIWIQRHAYPDQIDPYELQWRRRSEKDNKETEPRPELRQVLFSNVSLEDLEGLHEIYTAMRRKSETAFLDDVMAAAMPSRIFVMDALGLRFDEWPLSEIFPDSKNYDGLPKPVVDFQIRLKNAAFNFMELIGMLQPGTKITSEAFKNVQVTVAEEIQADGKPIFFMTLHLSSAPLNLNEEDIEEVPEENKKDFKEAFDFFYPIFRRGGNISTSLAINEAKGLDRIAGKNPSENWMFYYDAALKWIGLAANWLQEPISGELWTYTLQLQRYLTFANQSLQKVQQYSPQGPEAFEPIIRKIKVLNENPARTVLIFKDQQQRHEIRSGISKEVEDKPKNILELALPPADIILRNPDSAAVKRQARLKMEQALSSGFQTFERRIENAGDFKSVNSSRLKEWADEAFGNWAAAVDTQKLGDRVAESLKETGDFQIAPEVLRKVKAVLDHPEYFSAKGEPLFSENANAVLESELLFAFGNSKKDEMVRQELLQAYRWAGILYPVGDREPRLRKLTAGAGDRLALFPYKEGTVSAKKISQRDLERGRETPVTVSLKGTPVIFSSNAAAREKFKDRGVALDSETLYRLKSLGLNFRQVLTLFKIYTSPTALRRQLQDRPDAFPELTPGALKTGLETLASLWTRDLENSKLVQAAA